MAIEVAPKAAAAAPKTGAAPDARGAKGAGKPEASAGTGGFMAVLSALDQPNDAAQPGSTPTDAASLGLPGAATTAWTDSQAQVDSAAVANTTLPIALANPMAPVAWTPSAASLPSEGVAASTLAAVPAITLATGTGTTVNTVPVDALAGGAAAAPGTKASTTLASAAANTLPQAARADANSTANASDATSTTGTAWATSRAKALARAASQGDTAAPAPPSNANPDTQAASRVQDARWFAAMQAQRNAVPTAEVVAPQIAPQAAASPERGSSERYAAAKQSSDLLPGSSAAEPSAAGNGSSPVGDMAPVATEPPESVKYWMSQDVQNAELQVDGLGNGPVEVQISLQGKEAHVAFRSDESATLSLLQGAGADLKDALQREGVVLMGVSVGTSGSQDGRGGERKPRQNVRIAQVAAPQNAPAPATARPAGGAARSVDLFV